MVATAPSKASCAPAASASRMASGRATWWSAGSMTMTPFGSRRFTCSAARPTQGAVLRGQGSTRRFSRGSLRRIRRAAAAWFGPQTTKVSWMRASGGSRSTVAASMGSSPSRGRNCLGRFLRLSGQNRVPLPPAITTGKSFMRISRR